MKLIICTVWCRQFATFHPIDAEDAIGRHEIKFLLKPGDFFFVASSPTRGALEEIIDWPTRGFHRSRAFLRKSDPQACTNESARERDRGNHQAYFRFVSRVTRARARRKSTIARDYRPIRSPDAIFPRIKESLYVIQSIVGFLWQVEWTSLCRSRFLWADRGYLCIFLFMFIILFIYVFIIFIHIFVKINKNRI